MHTVQIGNATLINGNCYQIIDQIHAQACITDPPYGINLGSLCGVRNVQFRRNSASPRPPGWFTIEGDDQPFNPTPFLRFEKVILFGGNNFSSRLPDSRAWIAWDKREGGTSDNQGDWEAAWTNLPGPMRLYRHLWRGMARRGEENVSRQRLVHPTQKPIALMAFCIELCKLPEGSTIVDPFMGSAPIGIAALRAGMKYIGVESDPQHYATALERIHNAERQGIISMSLAKAVTA